MVKMRSIFAPNKSAIETLFCATKALALSSLLSLRLGLSLLSKLWIVVRAARQTFLPRPIKVFRLPCVREK